MKFTKTAFRKAFKEADQTLLWKLTYLKLGHTPTKGDVHKLIGEVVNPKDDEHCLDYRLFVFPQESP